MTLNIILSQIFHSSLVTSIEIFYLISRQQLALFYGWAKLLNVLLLHNKITLKTAISFFMFPSF